jgi:hypothetical protein
MKYCSWAMLALLANLIGHGNACADGGALQLYERAGPYRVALFVSPSPLRAGPIDLGILVQDPTTGSPSPQTTVRFRLRRLAEREWSMPYFADSTTATNKMLQAAHIELPESGAWELQIDVEGPPGQAQIHHTLEVADPLPRWRELWLWFTWPALAFVLFGAHQYLTRNRPKPSL